ncbi:MAG: RNA 3'-phosphate cyclase [Chloroflexi bacterium]|nr:RNA 3'-phosphate cyclase [Chloroflexota bacterium]MCI0578294.1 RNA 3'-phosphate cyclase [Chloroflexota bacterium]MCI0648757.1 RNA 3'-phosphate cyclase [Chloroflexota bacterium]MCI0727225.1 RNA 3'-phosphate cyclase [Chloroflexota bacterium]
MLVIDGSQGEGGGQVLRTSLSLSALTGRPFRIEKIRANRSRPGLRPQHLTAVRAVAAICRAEVNGDQLNSTVLEFRPGGSPRAGAYEFDVTEASASGVSAGAVTLIFQAVCWPLLFAGDSSQLTLSGGTFVPFSPPYHYLAEVAGPVFARMGAFFDLALREWGWMAAGGGLVTATIHPSQKLHSLTLEPAPESSVLGIAAVTNLPSHIPHRMERRAYKLLTEAGLQATIRPLRERSAGPGAGMLLWLPQAGFSSLGRPGLPAEQVTEAAVAELLDFVDNQAAVDLHLADQLLIPMTLAHGTSTLTTNRLTLHTLTNADLLRRWLDAAITIDGNLDGPGQIMVVGVGFGED